jgi:hypothetical protein
MKQTPRDCFGLAPPQRHMHVNLLIRKIMLCKNLKNIFVFVKILCYLIPLNLLQFLLVLFLLYMTLKNFFL